MSGQIVQLISVIAEGPSVKLPEPSKYVKPSLQTSFVVFTMLGHIQSKNEVALFEIK